MSFSSDFFADVCETVKSAVSYDVYVRDGATYVGGFKRVGKVSDGEMVFILKAGKIVVYGELLKVARLEETSALIEGKVSKVEIDA
jgi:hypothetical protein